MSFLKRLFGHPPVPEWASFLKPEQFDRFISLVERELRRLGFAFQTDRSAGVIAARKEGRQDSHQLGLTNLAQRCAQTSEADWPDVVAKHVGALVSIESSQTFLESLKNDFEKARELLKIRIYDAAALAEMPEGSHVYWRPADGIVAALTFDLPTTVATVSSDHVEAWGREPEELFRIGLENVRATRLQAEEVAVDEEVRITVLEAEAEDFFTATRALVLEDYLDPIPELGAIVAIPHREALLVYPIRDSSVLPAIQSLLPITLGMYDEGPGSISPHLFWWHRGELTCLPAAVEGDTIEFQPPREFVDGVLSRVVEST
ncbi:MAG: hypothetical protein ACK47B_28960 [Armatimonadota bacterium]